MIEKPLASLQSLSVITLATIVGIWTALPAVANAAGTDAAAGQQVFQTNCTACHTVGKGALVGPDLKGVTERRPREWLEQWISAPDAMLAKKDPYATNLLHQFHDVPMPNLGLSAADVNAVIAYLAGGAAQSSAETSSAPAVQGNPEVGRELFTGAVRFGDGGPPCMACHSTGGIGALGGGQLGPDLTTVVARFGGASAVDAFVAGTPTPTMKAVWSKHPLTTEERANVVAFLGQVGVSQRPTEAIWQLGGLAVLGAVILLVIAGVRWQSRSTFGVRRPMVARRTTGIAGPYNGGWFKGPHHPGWKARFRPAEDNKDWHRAPSIPPRRR
jgi:cytochrome c2